MSAHSRKTSDAWFVLLSMVLTLIAGCSQPVPTAPPQTANGDSAAVEVVTAEPEPAAEPMPAAEPKPAAEPNEVKAAVVASPPRSLTEILNAVDDGVVYITAKDALRRDVGFGTGFVVDRSGLIATNYHVLEAAVTATVQLRNGDKLEIAGVRAWDADHDLAIIQLQTPPETLEAFTLTMPRELVQGEELIAIGHPSGFKYTVTTGIVSAVRKASELPEEYQEALGADDETLWVQTSAAISSGSSGGPLMTADGAVVAVNTWIGAGQNLSFGVHVQHLLALLQKLDAEPAALPLPGTGLLIDSEVAGIYDKNLLELNQLMQEARRQPSGQQASRMMLEKYPVPRNAERLFDIATRHRGTNKGFEALYAVCAMTGTHRGKLKRLKVRAVQELHSDYLDHPRLGDALRQLGATHAPAVFDLLQTVRTQHADPNIRGLATGTLATSLATDPVGMVRYAPEIEDLLETALADYPNARWGRWKWETEGLQRTLFRFQHLIVGREAPEITGQQIDGSELKLSSLRGKVVVLDFWADWCPHCRDMYEPTRELVARLQDEPFAFVGVNGDPLQTVQPLVSQKTVTWANWMDGPDGPIAKEWEVEAYPVTFVIDARGVIRYRDLRGPILEQAVKSMLAAEAFRLPRDLVPAGSDWKYDAGDTDLGTAWRSPEYDDSSWSSGPAPLGYESIDIATTLPKSTRPTAYARRTIEIS
ncbi:MAG TPA: trypsin-like peptidase domain-containing protein, partial [Planctomycetaceae bacterium]|nr:trypsin-like peptidase domain-containing protein [Planctomycetaceae bacterium]